MKPSSPFAAVKHQSGDEEPKPSEILGTGSPQYWNSFHNLLVLNCFLNTALTVLEVKGNAFTVLQKVKVKHICFDCWIIGGKQGQKEGKKNPRKKWGHMKLRKDLWYDWWPVKVRGTWDKGTKYWSMTTRGKIMQVAYCKFPSLTNRKTNRNRPGFCHSYRWLSGNNKVSLCHTMLWEKKNNSGLEVFAL